MQEQSGSKGPDRDSDKPPADGPGSGSAGEEEGAGEASQDTPGGESSSDGKQSPN